MYRVFILLAITFTSISNANTSKITGLATVIDGNTLKIDDQSIQLYGIDAAESEQMCKRKDLIYNCGREAANRLASITAGKVVSCMPKTTDQEGRLVGVCFIGKTELNKWMVIQGLALPYLEHGEIRYKKEQQQAIQLKRGLYEGAYQLPWEYRKNKETAYVIAKAPAKVPVKTPKPRKAPEYKPPSPNPSLNKVFRNCAEARAAGAAPVKIGQPGYSRRLDRDGDGIGCEK